MTSTAPADLRPLRAPHAAGPRSPDAPQGTDQAHADGGDTAFAPHRPRIRRAAPAGPDLSLGPLGWLAVLLLAVLLTVLAHVGSVYYGQSEHREPSLFTDPAYVLADPAYVLSQRPSE